MSNKKQRGELDLVYKPISDYGIIGNMVSAALVAWFHEVLPGHSHIVRPVVEPEAAFPHAPPQALPHTNTDLRGVE
ncbi:hypothetical protein ACFLU1_05630 [Chloroflexota bacterium]